MTDLHSILFQETLYRIRLIRKQIVHTSVHVTV